MKEAKEGYMYLHTNGELIWKPSSSLSDLEGSDFVKSFWWVDSKVSFDAMINDAVELGAHGDLIERFKLEKQSENLSFVNSDTNYTNELVGDKFMEELKKL